MSQIEKWKDPGLRNRALQNLIFEWAAMDNEQAERWADGLPADFPEGRAYSFLRISRAAGVSRERSIGLVKKAWREAEREPDAFESQRIRMLAGKGMAKLDLAGACPTSSRHRGSFLPFGGSFGGSRGAIPPGTAKGPRSGRRNSPGAFPNAGGGQGDRKTSGRGPGKSLLDLQGGVEGCRVYPRTLRAGSAPDRAGKTLGGGGEREGEPPP